MLFVIKLSIGLMLFKQLHDTNYFVWYCYLNNSKEDMCTRAWQLASLVAALIFVFADLSLIAAAAAASISTLADKAACQDAARNGIRHGLIISASPTA